MEENTQIYGIRAVVEAISADKPVDKVFIQKGFKGELSKELEALIRKKGINASYVPIEKLDRMTTKWTMANISSRAKNK